MSEMLIQKNEAIDHPKQTDAILKNAEIDFRILFPQGYIFLDFKFRYISRTCVCT